MMSSRLAVQSSLFWCYCMVFYMQKIDPIRIQMSCWMRHIDYQLLFFNGDTHKLVLILRTKIFQVKIYLWEPLALSCMKPVMASSRLQISRVFLTSSAAKSSATAAKDEILATLQSESLIWANLSSSRPWKVDRLFSVSRSQVLRASSIELTEPW